ncbi:hypothetical protein [Levilactobacillus huananensis]|nr:hypothetical protein [Levilactobacillus huananensis]
MEVTEEQLQQMIQVKVKKAVADSNFESGFSDLTILEKITYFAK